MLLLMKVGWCFSFADLPGCKSPALWGNKKRKRLRGFEWKCKMYFFRVWFIKWKGVTPLPLSTLAHHHSSRLRRWHVRPHLSQLNILSAARSTPPACFKHLIFSLKKKKKNLTKCAVQTLKTSRDQFFLVPFNIFASSLPCRNIPQFCLICFVSLVLSLFKLPVKLIFEQFSYCWRDSHHAAPNSPYTGDCAVILEYGSLLSINLRFYFWLFFKQ